MPEDIDKDKFRNLVQIYRKNIERELGAKLQAPKKISSKEYQEYTFSHLYI